MSERGARSVVREAVLWSLVLLLVVGAGAVTVWAQAQGAAPVAGEATPEAAVAEAPAAEAQPLGGFYFHPLGLAYLILFAGVWVLVWDWVYRDAGKVEQRGTLWGLLLWSTGLLHFLFVLVLPNIFLGAGVGVVLFAGATTAYIWMRNARVPESQRVLTQSHLGLVVRRFMYQFGVIMAPPEPKKAAAGDRETIPVILRQHDGVVRDETQQEGRVEADAILAGKSMLGEAVSFRASDIHIEPKTEQIGVRYRIDGMLHSYTPFPNEVGTAVINAIKVLSGMDIAVRRRPQDGSFSAEFPSLHKSADFRVSTSPSVLGETMVIRILDRERAFLRIGQLGMGDRMVGQITRLAEATRGMLLIAGPTGAGKTTSLYGILGTIDVYQRNVMTLENPVEYRLENVTQISVEERGGVQFASALRSVVRQDPDVIMVGEIRDRDTAEVALDAVTTGHLVLSTVHAPDVVGSVFRLIQLGVDPATLAANLTSAMTQRLVRVLCASCKVPYKPKDDLVTRLHLQPAKVNVFYRAAGCPACAGTGFYGRTGIFELLVLNDEVREQIRRQPSVTMLRDAATKAGMVSLYEAGLQKVIEGATSVKEMLRIIK
jgi:general secretion pathway protein E